MNTVLNPRGYRSERSAQVPSAEEHLAAIELMAEISLADAISRQPELFGDFVPHPVEIHGSIDEFLFFDRAEPDQGANNFPFYWVPREFGDAYRSRAHYRRFAVLFPSLNGELMAYFEQNAPWHPNDGRDAIGESTLEMLFKAHEAMALLVSAGDPHTKFSDEEIDSRLIYR